MNQYHVRFSEAPWYPKGQEVYILVGGAGGIGSWAILLLARAGFYPVIYDFDLIEEHNLGGQLYARSYITKYKVDAMQDIVNKFSGSNIIAFTEAITKDTPTNMFCISAFDNMDARKSMYAGWYETYGHDSDALFMDGRLNAEQMQIFCVPGGNSDSVKAKQAEYLEKHLFNDSDVADEPCTFKQTSHSAAMIASHMVGFFTNHYTNVVEKENTRSVPFKWEYYIPMDYLNYDI